MNFFQFHCADCGYLVWPWQRQASFGPAGFKWWQASLRWHTSCLAKRAPSSPVWELWSDNED